MRPPARESYRAIVAQAGTSGTHEPPAPPRAGAKHRTTFLLPATDEDAERERDRRQQGPPRSMRAGMKTPPAQYRDRLIPPGAGRFDS